MQTTLAQPAAPLPVDTASSGPILRDNETPLWSKLSRAYVSLALIPEGADGSRTVSLARFGAYEVRLVEFPQSPAADTPPIRVGLYRRDTHSPLDSRPCDDLDAAAAAAEHLIVRARQLYGTHANSSRLSPTPS
jgi:hypothetical protein